MDTIQNYWQEQNTTLIYSFCIFSYVNFIFNQIANRFIDSHPFQYTLTPVNQFYYTFLNLFRLIGMLYEYTILAIYGYKNGLLDFGVLLFLSKIICPMLLMTPVTYLLVIIFGKDNWFIIKIGPFFTFFITFLAMPVSGYLVWVNI